MNFQGLLYSEKFLNQFNTHEKMEKNPLYSFFEMDSFDKDETDALANVFWKVAFSMEFLKALKKNDSVEWI